MGQALANARAAPTDGWKRDHDDRYYRTRDAMACRLRGDVRGPYRATTAAEATLDVRSDAVSATAVLRAAPRGTIPDATQLRVALHAGQPWLDRSADVFVMLFNNVYSTNFAQWIEGSWSSRVRLWAPDKEQSTEETLIGSSWEARDACLAAISNAPPGKLPPTAAGLSITKKPTGGEPSAVLARTTRGLLVTAFGPNPYGDGTLLRLWDQAGNAGTYTIGLPDGMQARTAQPCDLRGQIAGPTIKISDRGTFDVTIRPMSPTNAILRVETARKP